MIKKKYYGITFFIFLSLFSFLFYRLYIILYETDPEQFRWDWRVQNTFIISDIYMTMIIILLISRNKKQRFSLKRKKDIFEYIIIPVISGYTILYTCCASPYKYVFDYTRRNYMIINFTVMSLSIISFILLERISKNRELEIQNILLNSEREMYQSQIKISNQYIEEISGIKHDMKNKILCISEFLNEDKIQEAKELCRSIKNELANTSCIFYTENIYLNSILNVLSQKAKENHIDIKIMIKSNLENIKGEDLICILGNLGDNAIENLCKENFEKSMSITLSERGGYYMITVKNYISSSVLEKNPDLQSTKNNHLYHGHGMKTVKKSVKNYEGDIKILEEEHLFIVTVILKNTKYH